MNENVRPKRGRKPKLERTENLRTSISVPVPLIEKIGRSVLMEKINTNLITLIKQLQKQ